jgi:hypothetical protein
MQKYSSYAFSIFGLIHITNTAIIPLVTRSVASSETYLLLTRPYYQSRIQEPLLIVAPLAIHILSGVALRVYRRRQNARRYGAESRAERRGIKWPAVSGTSALGYTLIPLVLGHTFVVRGLPLWYEGSSANSGLGFVAHGFSRLPLSSVVGYTTLVVVGVWHIAWGWAKWTNWAPSQTTRVGGEREIAKKRRWYTINGIAASVGLVWLAGGLGIIGRGGSADGWLVGVYDGLYRRIPLLGAYI